MSKKKNAVDVSKFNVDFNSKYYIPMSKLEDRYRKAVDTIIVPCDIQLLQDGYTIKATHEGYHPSYFYIEFFDWQVYRNKFTKVVDI